ncbi:hypothetical protein L226DRAFT_523556 [Lentinus tigrinus ALCF2SS1-7]|uniref:uncharacterized protein n=1 Tax=Lentinus tigrinus ALCF2SS1-7 TaxID=1328758 RepID=UPI001165E972|nr:hypothetical protein L226DRAFT_523556 [Lentinus tigrinus ALCF2SS1-7]
MSSCANLINAIQAIFILPYFPWAVFSGLRTYALCGRRLRLPLGIFVFLLSSVSIGVNFARYRWLSSAPIPMLGCVEEASASAEIAKGSNVACNVPHDPVSTNGRTAEYADIFGHSIARWNDLFPSRLPSVLLTLNTLHLLFTMLSISSAAFESVSYVSIFTDPITSALVSRFILNLQEVNQSRAAAPELTSSSSDQSSIKFMKTRILGSLGSTLPLPGDNARELEDDWDGLVFKESGCGFHEANGQEADTSRFVTSLPASRRDGRIPKDLLLPSPCTLRRRCRLNLTQPIENGQPQHAQEELHVLGLTVLLEVPQNFAQRRTGPYRAGIGHRVTANRCGIAAFTLVLCEYFVHLPREVELFWKRTVTGASVLFLSNRYLMPLSELVQILTYGPMSEKSCANITDIIPAITLLPYFPWAGMLVFLLSSVPIGVNFVDYRWLSSTADPVLGCLEQVDEPPHLRKNHYRLPDMPHRLRPHCLVRDLARNVPSDQNGASDWKKEQGYLLRNPSARRILVTLNTLHLLFTVLSIASNAPIAVSYITIFTEPITSILVSRFILNLQEVNQTISPELTSLSAGQSSIYFTKTRIIGSLGSSLPFPSDTLLDSENSDGIEMYGHSVSDGAGDKVINSRA